LKFFDSAGLLGICFREKGMMDEAIAWFEKALGTSDRKDDEYNAVKYEMVQTARLKEDFLYAKKLAFDIMKKDPNYRDIKAVFQDLKDK
jgi:tetratricopeptide (TPR) repeat protein